VTAPGTWYARTEGEDVFSMEVVSVSAEEMVYDTWLNVPTGTGLEHIGRHSITLEELDHLLEEGHWEVLATPAEVSGS
jgi:hypothetical protein